MHCFVTPSNSKFLLVHEGRQEDAIKLFFNEVYEFYTRMQLSPFFDPNEPVRCPQFEQRVLASSKKAF